MATAVSLIQHELTMNDFCTAESVMRHTLLYKREDFEKTLKSLKSDILSHPTAMLSFQLQTMVLQRLRMFGAGESSPVGCRLSTSMLCMMA